MTSVRPLLQRRWGVLRSREMLIGHHHGRFRDRLGRFGTGFLRARYLGRSPKALFASVMRAFGPGHSSRVGRQRRRNSGTIHRYQRALRQWRISHVTRNVTCSGCPLHVNVKMETSRGWGQWWWWRWHSTDGEIMNVRRPQMTGDE